VRVISNEGQLRKFASKPHVKRWEILAEKLVLFELVQRQIKLNRPIYIGFSVLEEAKIHMYRFHYNIMRPLYPAEGQLRLLFTDTDSLCYLVHTEGSDIYEDMRRLPDLAIQMDTSNFPRDHPSFSNENARVLGKFKEEQPPPNCVVKFCGLRAKLYALLNADGSSKTTCKGVPRRKKEQYAAYVECLQSQAPRSTTFSAIRSHLHTVSTDIVSKLAMCIFDDKRYILPDGVHSLPHGHYTIPPRDLAYRLMDMEPPPAAVDEEIVPSSSICRKRAAPPICASSSGGGGGGGGSSTSFPPPPAAKSLRTQHHAAAPVSGAHDSSSSSSSDAMEPSGASDSDDSEATSNLRELLDEIVFD